MSAGKNRCWRGRSRSRKSMAVRWEFLVTDGGSKDRHELSGNAKRSFWTPDHQPDYKPPRDLQDDTIGGAERRVSRGEDGEQAGNRSEPTSGARVESSRTSGAARTDERVGCPHPASNIKCSQTARGAVIAFGVFQWNAKSTLINGADETRSKSTHAYNWKERWLASFPNRACSSSRLPEPSPYLSRAAELFRSVRSWRYCPACRENWSRPAPAQQTARFISLQPAPSNRPALCTEPPAVSQRRSLLHCLSKPTRRFRLETLLFGCATQPQQFGVAFIISGSRSQLSIPMAWVPVIAMCRRTFAGLSNGKKGT
ncbi:hypothetical protein B0T20DRAFT_390820 [Sordaria brevicollis]|uniref:Uncharacterized protein n=1 Tax=Sordaria brevicollis TaxID=83679 RepID=A0AAE0PJI2_SORBR|nr:hypothetical protein B0T20DRAFT_390820 [Sordaria brevicollis]